MRFSERSIKIAFDRTSGEILEADDLFKSSKKESFAVRNEYHSDIIDLYCCECDQKLAVSGSKYDRLHFKHFPNHAPCILTSNNFTPQELVIFANAARSKESKRHKELKNKIGERLAKVPGVDASSICIDNKFIIRGEEKRKPDVYCQYDGKELVFEIQLSDLSLGYILDRYKFYQRNGMYLIWILDNFDVRNQSQMVRDLKYLNHYHNFFKLDESLEEFKLMCEYKIAYVGTNSVQTKWQKSSVQLETVNFDSDLFQVYYYDLPGKMKEKEAELDKQLSILAETEKQRVETARQIDAKQKSKKIISFIRTAKERNWPNYSEAKEALEEMDTYELKVFNSELNLDRFSKNGSPALHQWVSQTTNESRPFMLFLLTTRQIYLDVNETDSQGVTTLQKIYANSNIWPYGIVKHLFQRGYSITDDDCKFLLGQQHGKQLATFYSLCSRIKDKSLIDFMFNNEKLILIIESARQNEIIGFSYPADGWIAFANNAIHNRSKYWDYIEPAFKHYGLWDKLIELDKKGTFQKKLEKFYLNMPQQNYDFDAVFEELYPEVNDVGI